jgi:hypothetical protein
MDAALADTAYRKSDTGGHSRGGSAGLPLESGRWWDAAHVRHLIEERMPRHFPSRELSIALISMSTNRLAVSKQLRRPTSNFEEEFDQIWSSISGRSRVDLSRISDLGSISGRSLYDLSRISDLSSRSRVDLGQRSKLTLPIDFTGRSEELLVILIGSCSRTVSPQGKMRGTWV